MKKRSLFILLIFCLGIFTLGLGIPVKAMQPTWPNEVKITVTGIDIEYEVTILSKVEPEEDLYQIFDSSELDENHKILLYKDSEGYEYKGHEVVTCNGESRGWYAYTPEVFKIIIVTKNNTVYVTREIERFKFDEKYLIDLTDVIEETSTEIIIVNDISKDHSYIREVTILIIRILLLVGIEILIALLFLINSKREIKIIIFINLITHIILNSLLNLCLRASDGLGIVVYIFFVIVLGVIVLVIETIIYGVKFENKFKGILYGILANFITLIGLLVFWGTIK